MDFPEDFLKEIKDILKTEYEDFLKSYDMPVSSGIRANTLKTDRASLRELLNKDLRDVPWCENGLYLTDDLKASQSPYYYAGLYYIQEPSAMAPAALLAPDPGDKVLDLCAAPGGKSTALGAYLKGEGLLVSNDVSPSRARALVKNIEISGIRNSIITCEMPEKLETCFPEYFDKILVDAPCSGQGMFHKKPSMVEYYKDFGPEYYNKLQRPIILSAARMLKPGGTMVYSTCTFSRLENEETIDFLIRTMPEMSIIKTFRLWPHKVRGEGHFAALLKKTGTEREEIKKNVSGSDKCTVFEDFCAEKGIINKIKDLSLRKDHISKKVMDDDLLKGLRVLKNGWYLGEIKNKRFEPSESFAMGLYASEISHKISFSINDERVIRYLKGETVDIPETDINGYVLICLEDHPLGWGKVHNGMLKNKYPAGWRIA